MMNRRDALKLGAAGLMGSGILPGGSHGTIAMQTPEPMDMPELSAGWPMGGGNPARTGVMTGPGPSFEAPVVVEWSLNNAGGGSGQWTMPVVDEGTLYHSPGAFAGVHALDFETGIERWRALDGHDINGQIASDGTILVAAADMLHALDASTGAERWSTRLDGILSHTMMAVDGHLYCRTAGGIVAVNADNGAERWSFEERSDDRSSIALDGGTLYFASVMGAVVAIDTETGMERWRLSIPPGDSQSYSSVIVVDGTVYLRDYQGSLSAIDATSGMEHWRTPAATLDQLSAVHHGRVYGANAELGACALDATTGDALWSFSTIQFMEISGVSGDTVLAQGTGSWREMWRVHGLDAATGEERWSFECPPRMYSPTVIGNRLLVSGIMVYVCGNIAAPTLGQDTVIRGAPSTTGVERDTARAGTEIASVGEQVDSNGETWVRVTIGDLTGWIPLSAIDPTTLPPDGDIEYVYNP